MRVLSLVAILAVAVTVLVAAPASAAAPVTVVAAGLDSPRGVAVSRGKVLVGEAGHGGDVCAPGPEGSNCVGLSSRISVVDPGTGHHHPLVSGLFSASMGEAETIGVSGIAVRGGEVLAVLGAYPQAFGQITCGPTAPPDCAAVKAGAVAQAGHLISVAPDGTWRSLASVGAFGFDYTANIPHQEHDANPYGVLPADDDVLVADAGANTLDRVTERGAIRVVHYFHYEPPPGAFPTDAVPTCVVRAGGKLWVADLSGRLFRLDGATATEVPVVDRNGNRLIRHVTGCSSGGDADDRGAGDADDGAAIYLVNMWTTETFPTPNTGSVVRYNVRAGRASIVADKLNFPNMVAVGPRHALFVSANSVCPASGGPAAQCRFMGETSGVLLRIALPSERDD
jgi:hypothetical protein